MAVLGFIGTGNMGYAMLKGASNVMEKSTLLYTDVNKEKLEEVKLVFPMLHPILNW